MGASETVFDRVSNLVPAADRGKQKKQDVTQLTVNDHGDLGLG
jgi:hypothetical protein